MVSECADYSCDPSGHSELNPPAWTFALAGPRDGRYQESILRLYANIIYFL
jgi:hypothetical protein